ncbi:Phosphoadenosine phosphosulfate reductase [Poriferisphaera corsica]|uniref:Phosphoadenosine 5'-phosphosulfate reductase n=1 Tax=Poriferisphaera corsica TaxID=2528020 RepID=A0A517YU15_9BACT|nr:phosphoadenylyl-sulfate reductase [Poriferisphaera corsica]QDU33707.1 Phosphoadenosine phosphosulfate reductase [Poriferisphaera corsica]
MSPAISDHRSEEVRATIDLPEVNEQLNGKDATEIIAWAYENFESNLVMTSSFGAQAALMLHLVTRVVPNIPVIFIDTGYHFAETYQFADDLAERLNLNLKIYQANISPAYMEAKHGKLWEAGETDDEIVANLNKYDRLRKVEPMQRALSELEAASWLAGLRGQQTSHRSGLQTVAKQDGRYKVHPILTWSQKDVYEYLKANDLPTHPLYEQGYKSIGDWHSTRPIGADEDERAGRFKGLKQECGLHLPTSQEEGESRDASML